MTVRSIILNVLNADAINVYSPECLRRKTKLGSISERANPQPVISVRSRDQTCSSFTAVVSSFNLYRVTVSDWK